MSKVLDLSTIDPERPTITVDGVGYELMLQDDLTLRELARAQKLQATVNKLMEHVEDIAETDILLMADALDGLVSLALPTLPADVMAKLRDGQKLQIVQQAFRRVAETRGNSLPQNPLTGAN